DVAILGPDAGEAINVPGVHESGDVLLLDFLAGQFDAIRQFQLVNLLLERLLEWAAAGDDAFEVDSAIGEDFAGGDEVFESFFRDEPARGEDANVFVGGAQR